MRQAAKFCLAKRQKMSVSNFFRRNNADNCLHSAQCQKSEKYVSARAMNIALSCGASKAVPPLAAGMKKKNLLHHKPKNTTKRNTPPSLPTPNTNRQPIDEVRESLGVLPRSSLAPQRLHILEFHLVGSSKNCCCCCSRLPDSRWTAASPPRVAADGANGYTLHMPRPGTKWFSLVSHSS
jgi:hypothetical protein